MRQLIMEDSFSPECFDVEMASVCTNPTATLLSPTTTNYCPSYPVSQCHAFDCTAKTVSFNGAFPRNDLVSFPHSNKHKNYGSSHNSSTLAAQQSLPTPNASETYNASYSALHNTIPGPYHSKYANPCHINVPAAVTDMRSSTIPTPPSQLAPQKVMYMPIYYQREKKKVNPDKLRKKRRKHDEVNRQYPCDYPGCTKSYGKVSHLNTHRESKDHGPRVSIHDFY